MEETHRVEDKETGMPEKVVEGMDTEVGKEMVSYCLYYTYDYMYHYKAYSSDYKVYNYKAYNSDYTYCH